MSIQPCREKWPAAMTDRERFNNQMHYRPVDRCFNMEFGYWKENYQQWSIFLDNGVTCHAEADVLFNFDRIATTGKNVDLCPPFEERVVEERGDKLIVQNRDGMLAEVPRDDHATIPHYIKSAIDTPDDWKRIKAERFDPDSPGRAVDVAALLAAHPNDRDYPLGVNCGSMIGRVRDLLSVEGLAYAMYDYPAMVEDMVETMCVLAERALDELLGKMDFDYAMGWEDICFKNGPLVSVNFFRDVVAPRYKRINRKLKAHGIDIWYTDCDGDVRPILPLLLESGINCLFPFEVNCCAHPAELLDEYGKDLRIMGGVDKIQLGKGPEAIRAYMDTLAPLVERGGYIPFCDHRCPPNVKQEDYLFYLDLKQEMFGKLS